MDKKTTKSSNIIGYYSYWGEGILEQEGVTLEELKNSNVKLKTASIGIIKENDSGQLTEEEREKEILFEMIQKNETTIADYCNRTGIVRIMYKYPITYKAYMESLGFDKKIPIFENQKEFLKL